MWGEGSILMCDVTIGHGENETTEEARFFGWDADGEFAQVRFQHGDMLIVHASRVHNIRKALVEF